MPNTSNLIRDDKPPDVTGCHQRSPGPATTPATSGSGWAGLLRRIGDRLFAANDAEGRWRGWQIGLRHAGLGRRYRDPRFDTLIGCLHCHGTGATAGTPCAPCSGTGRMILDGAVAQQDGREAS